MQQNLHFILFDISMYPFKDIFLKCTNSFQSHETHQVPTYVILKSLKFEICTYLNKICNGKFFYLLIAMLEWSMMSDFENKSKNHYHRYECRCLLSQIHSATQLNSEHASFLAKKHMDHLYCTWLHHGKNKYGCISCVFSPRKVWSS
jgi:hypothetical protein